MYPPRRAYPRKPIGSEMRPSNGILAKPDYARLAWQTRRTRSGIGRRGSSASTPLQSRMYPHNGLLAEHLTHRLSDNRRMRSRPQGVDGVDKNPYTLICDTIDTHQHPLEMVHLHTPDHLLAERGPFGAHVHRILVKVFAQDVGGTPPQSISESSSVAVPSQTSTTPSSMKLTTACTASGTAPSVVPVRSGAVRRRPPFQAEPFRRQKKNRVPSGF